MGIAESLRVANALNVSLDAIDKGEEITGASSTVTRDSATRQHDAVDKGEEITGASCTVASISATRRHGQAGNLYRRTAEASTLEQNRGLLSRAWKLGLPSTKKLLILDVNGLLVARYAKIDKSVIPGGTQHGVVGKTYMFKRPLCNAFLDFCLENFHVGIWSSMKKVNVLKALDYICKGRQHKFMFVMHQGDCTLTGFRNPDKTKQPLFLKELVKVRARYQGQFSESNTLLIDDTPYKALRNPPHTAIFPKAYTYNEADDFLMGSLREYLQGLRDAVDVPEFVRTHPIGEPAIAPGCQHWNVYQKILGVKLKEVPLHVIPQTTSQELALLVEQNRLQNLSLSR